MAYGAVSVTGNMKVIMDVKIRNSERRCYKRCPQRWYWTYVRGLKAIRVANPLWFGQLIHIALAEWYRPGLKRGPHPADTFLDVIKENRLIRVPKIENEKDEIEYIQAKELGLSMLSNYVDFYGTDPQWFVIATERKFEYRIRKLNSSGSKETFIYTGTVDGIVRHTETGMGRILEHKTAASINSSHLPLDDQAGSYWAVSKRILRDIDDSLKMEGIEYNFLRKALEDNRPKNKRGLYCNKPNKDDYNRAFTNARIKVNVKKTTVNELERVAIENNIIVLGAESKSQPPPLFERFFVFRSLEERITQLKRIKTEAWFIEQSRLGNIPLYKNPTHDCSWDCPFFRVCQLDEQGASDDVEDFIKASFRIGDPYLNEDEEQKSA